MQVLEVDDLRKEAIEDLVELSKDEGFNFLSRLVNEWENGKNRFEGEHEKLYKVELNGKIIGIGGINKNPYSEDEKEGRIRRFYIHPNYRKRKIGTRLIRKIIEDYKLKYQKLTLRTDNEIASKFYESIGFKKVESKNSTHAISFETLSSTTEF